MWSLLGYAHTPAMPPGAIPILARLAISHADGLHIWEGVWRLGVDAGRTEGVLIVLAIEAALLLFAAGFAVTFRLVGAAFRGLAKLGS